MYNIDFLTKNKNKKPFLAIMIGIPGSGKSTIAKEIAESYKRVRGEEVYIISSDAIRAEVLSSAEDQSNNELVFKIFHKRIKEHLSLGENVIADATNMSIKSRASILSLVGNKKYIKIAYIVDTSLEESKKRNRNRDRKVPEFVLEKMVRQFQIPYYEEGFDVILLHSWEESKLNSEVKNKVEYTSDNDILFNKLKGFNQHNHHHKFTLDIHTKKLYDLACQQYAYNKTFCRAASLHDIGKLFVGKPKDDGSGDYSYLGHHNYGAYYLLQYIPEIGFKNVDDVLECLFYVNYHMEPFFWYSRVILGFGEEGKIITEKTLNKMKNRYGEEHVSMLLAFNEFDKEASGTNGEK